MTRFDKHNTVLSSLEAFEGLRLTLAYLRSISIVFEHDTSDEYKGAIHKEIKGTPPMNRTQGEEQLFATYFLKAAIWTHVALLYTALVRYADVVKINPELRHERLDQEITTAKECGLDESMRQVRNAVFHIRPSTNSAMFVSKVIRHTLDNKLALGKLERLLYDATEQIFLSPEALFQEREEVLMQGYQDALAHYDKHLSNPDNVAEGSPDSFGGTARKSAS